MSGIPMINLRHLAQASRRLYPKTISAHDRIASGIVNDANDWAIETMGNPKYPLEPLQRVVMVSLVTQK